MKLEEIYHDKLQGSITGFDRIRFRGTLRCLSTITGILVFLSAIGKLLKEFNSMVLGITGKIIGCAQWQCTQALPFIWLGKTEDKDTLAKAELSKKTSGYHGLICVFSALECCVSPKVFGNKETKKIELKYQPTKCRHLYFYFQHPVLGFGHIRLQTWFPFGVTICINGRNWLENQLLAAGIGYQKAENCFLWLADVPAAQRLLDQQLATDWPGMLNGLLNEYCPWLTSALNPVRPSYYWSADETEVATDYMFKKSQDLDRLFPMFVRFAMMTSDCPAVMRFLGQKAGHQGGFKAPPEVSSDCRRRHEGVRVKHRYGNNSVKMYNKQGSILRIETTINDPRSFKVYRQPDDDLRRESKWLPMRKGVADLQRRATISRAVNERYADHIAAAETGERLGEVWDSICNRTTFCPRKSALPVKVRGLRPGEKEDMQLLTFLGKGNWDIVGFRNQDLVASLYTKPAKTDKEKKQRSAKATRLIRLLRAHGLVQKTKGENRYKVTEKGKKICSAILIAKNVPIQKLAEQAA